MSIPEIEEAAGKLAVTACNSEVQELAELVRQLAHETHESLEVLAAPAEAGVARAPVKPRSKLMRL